MCYRKNSSEDIRKKYGKSIIAKYPIMSHQKSLKTSE